ncbi:MDIS1-interacting receptor like kinase 2 [Bienertia sinuspersici]
MRLGLNLQHNNLSGPIPTSLASLTSLISADFSRNQLEGQLPDSRAFSSLHLHSFIDNMDLCGTIKGMKP